MKLRFTLSIVVLLLSACSTGGSTLADLKYKPKKEKAIEFKTLDYQQVRKEYQEILSLFKDDELKEQIERRIADVYMLESGDNQLKSKPAKSYYMEAIKSYREILDKYPNSPDNADILYQLARAYDMDGQTKSALEVLVQLTERHPHYKNNAEAYFRMGDIYYGQKKYTKAQTEYLKVSRMRNHKLIKYAHYMLGWTNYKRFNYEASIDAYAKVLSLVLGDSDDVEKLNATDKPLVDDSIQSMSLALAKNGGAEIIETLASLKGKVYLWKIYDSLGEYFLKKERYEDSADTFRRFVRQYKLSPKAPDLHDKLIAVYIKGKFAVQALNEKERYAETYGIHSAYAKKHGKPNEIIKQKLKVYFEEIASHYHNKAQTKQKAYQKLLAKDKSMVETPKSLALKKEFVAEFERATHFYAQYIVTFPSDFRVPEMTFLKAEAHFSIAQYPQAIKEFEHVAYQLNTFKEKKYQAKSGYAAVISYQKHIDGLKQKEHDVKRWQSNAVESMLRFSRVFHFDKRSPSVLTNAAEYLFSLNQYKRALEVAESLIKSNPKLDVQLKKTAYGIAAHCYFKLNNFLMAEKSYLSQRALVKNNSKEYKQISERTAAAIYKYSEELLSAKDKQAAIAQLSKIKTLTPSVKIRVSAQYDMTTLMLSLQQWDSAIAELLELSEKYSKHQLAFEFPRKLAFAYEKKKSWLKSANAYLALNKNDKDKKVRQDALFIAAGLFEKSKNYDTAITLFKRYAREYEEPFKVRMEARFRLAELYERVKQPAKQLFWLRRIIDGDKKAGESSNERSRWLAAWANAKYGDYFASEFKRHKLTSDLGKSFPRKNKALQQATQRYEMSADYGLLEFVSMTSLKTANLYLEFSKDLRKVTAPKGMSKADQKLFKSIIEEQATPFEQLGIELHIANIQRAWQGQYNQWISNSFTVMKTMSVARFNREEVEVSYGNEIR